MIRGERREGRGAWIEGRKMRGETDIPAYYQQFDHYTSLKFDGSAADLVIGMQIIQLRVHMKGEGRRGETGE